MVGELLVLSSHSSDEGPAGEEQILSFVVSCLGDDEELLLETQSEEDLLGIHSQSLKEIEGG